MRESSWWSDSNTRPRGGQLQRTISSEPDNVSCLQSITELSCCRTDIITSQQRADHRDSEGTDSTNLAHPFARDAADGKDGDRRFATGIGKGIESERRAERTLRWSIENGTEYDVVGPGMIRSPNFFNRMRGNPDQPIGPDEPTNRRYRKTVGTKMNAVQVQRQHEIDSIVED